MIKQFDLKEGIPSMDLTYLTPDALIVLAFVTRFCKKHSLPLVVTNILQKFKVSTSNTHPEGRAIDVSVRGWYISDINKCIAYITEMCGHLGAISAKTNKPRVAYYHNAGLGAHIHFQVFNRT